VQPAGFVNRDGARPRRSDVEAKQECQIGASCVLVWSMPQGHFVTILAHLGAVFSARRLAARPPG
jgi:hypothetical protein